MERETERGEGAEPECFWRILERAEKSACKRAGGATGGPTWANSYFSGEGVFEA